MIQRKGHSIHPNRFFFGLILSCLLVLACLRGRLLSAADKPPLRAEIEAGLKAHDRALFVKSGWIRDPYIVLGPDGFYYLTGTTPLPDDPRQLEDPYNTGLGRLWATAKSTFARKHLAMRLQDRTKPRSSTVDPFGDASGCGILLQPVRVAA